jgi:hypothetical protein
MGELRLRSEFRDKEVQRLNAVIERLQEKTQQHLTKLNGDLRTECRKADQLALENVSEAYRCRAGPLSDPEILDCRLCCRSDLGTRWWCARRGQVSLLGGLASAVMAAPPQVTDQLRMREQQLEQMRTQLEEERLAHAVNKAHDQGPCPNCRQVTSLVGVCKETSLYFGELRDLSRALHLARQKTVSRPRGSSWQQ